EVMEECGKHGVVQSVVIYKEHYEVGDPEVKIFVVFDSLATALKARTSLHRRWFGGRIVQATLYDEARFAAQDFSG
ncbi:hypothetical protein CYMTET_42795, partial [Cymbomonas tetramitiformis]